MSKNIRPRMYTLDVVYRKITKSRTSVLASSMAAAENAVRLDAFHNGEEVIRCKLVEVYYNNEKQAKSGTRRR